MQHSELLANGAETLECAVSSQKAVYIGRDWTSKSKVSCCRMLGETHSRVTKVGEAANLNLIFKNYFPVCSIYMHVHGFVCLCKCGIIAGEETYPSSSLTSHTEVTECWSSEHLRHTWKNKT